MQPGYQINTDHTSFICKLLLLSYNSYIRAIIYMPKSMSFELLSGKYEYKKVI